MDKRHEYLGCKSTTDTDGKCDCLVGEFQALESQLAEAKKENEALKLQFAEAKGKIELEIKRLEESKHGDFYTRINALEWALRRLTPPTTEVNDGTI